MTKRLSVKHYDPDCRQCERLACFLREMKARYPTYVCKPVPPFGDAAARLLIVGLAPGLHGANATGRPFTGDHAGIMLFRMLHEFGFSSAPQSTQNDLLALKNCRITNAVKCLPPQNKPIASEVNTCRKFLAEDLKTVALGGVFLALGKISHDSIVRALGLKISQYPFGHGAEYRLKDGRILLSSYHCSRYNTQTNRLTLKMFRDIFKRAKALL